MTDDIPDDLFPPEVIAFGLHLEKFGARWWLPCNMLRLMRTMRR